MGIPHAGSAWEYSPQVITPISIRLVEDGLFLEYFLRPAWAFGDEASKAPPAAAVLKNDRLDLSPDMV